MASAELITIAMPTATSAASKMVADRMPAVLSVLGGATDKQMFAASAIIAANDLPPDVDKVTTLKAVLGAAYLQLPFGSALGFVYLLPFKGKVTLCVGYQGFIELGMRAHFLRDVHADVVLRGEEYEYWKDETGPRLKHVPDAERVMGRNNVQAAYCIYHTVHGGRGIRVVTRKELDAVDSGKNVWNSAYPAMCMKTAIRRAAKEWRKSPELAYAVRADEQADEGQSPDVPPVQVDAEISDDKPWTPPTGEDE
jgi:recombination protein RecT